MRAISVVLVVFAVAGCDKGTANRIQEKYSVFVTLTPDKQKSVVDGNFEIGDLGDVVYMAIGTPSSVKSKQSSDGIIEMWTYLHTMVAPGVVKLSMDGANTSHYTAEQRSANAKAGGVGSPPSFSSTTPQASQSLNVPDMPANTLYVFLLNGRVSEIKLEGGN